jgi:hypothetical protein
VLNQAVSRNVERFPADFMFALDRDEIRSHLKNSRSQPRARRTPMKKRSNHCRL